MNPVLVDAGALVALLDRSDEWHEWAVTTFKTLRPPLFTCEAALTEAWHLLRLAPPSHAALMRLHREGILELRFDFQIEAPAVWRLLEKYKDVPMDFADACLVRMSEIFPKSQVWTTDSDFGIYRRHGRQPIHVLTVPRP